MVFDVFVLIPFAIIVIWLLCRDRKASIAVEKLEETLRAERRKNADYSAQLQNLAAEAKERLRQAGADGHGVSPYADLSQKDFILKILDELGCSHHDEKSENGRLYILLDYQGGHFCIDMDEESAWVTCVMPGIADASLDDLDNLSLTRRAVNEENRRPWSWYVVYSIDTEARKMNVHLYSHFVVMPRMPEAKYIFEAYLFAAFKRQRLFFLERDRLAAEGAPTDHAH